MTDMAELPSEPSGWLSDRELNHVRSELPLLYVNAIPVRINPRGELTHVGLLLRADDDGVISRAIVAGRVMYHETIRDALVRNLEKDLGAVALPRLPLDPAPFSVAEYFPTRGITKYHDSRQHAVALAFVVPVDGDCEPSQNALDIAWFTPEEAASEDIAGEMMGGQEALLKQALAFCGVLP
ncbi:NUDIX hydrolase family protein [Demequina capsici]|uniref:NUDIX hydrolase family protein n=1 Tax=Demequina capsici TaxID=3075620 RepID=A0AA96FAT2_9MICO|nr:MULTISPECIES: NUDIX hydrolase family protein [unclassified Demequina]WNM25226.1 NUDIX hydrolase family protein [Demequina sp. OYTSA14]WNM28139.1 NUDIX hydrolase family protein [Demequina sp. PMTSA13]